MSEMGADPRNGASAAANGKGGGSNGAADQDGDVGMADSSGGVTTPTRSISPVFAGRKLQDPSIDAVLSHVHSAAPGFGGSSLPSDQSIGRDQSRSRAGSLVQSSSVHSVHTRSGSETESSMSGYSSPTPRGPAARPRKLGMGMTLPDFPGPSKLREPVPQVPSSPPHNDVSPPLPSSPEPTSPPPPSRGLAIPRGSFEPPSFPSGGSSPWMALAASSGAPTPSIDGMPSFGRNSPHLGGPFERLNMNDSWSGANLFPSRSGDDRRPSLDPESGTTSSSSTAKGSSTASSPPSAYAGMSLDALAKAQNQALARRGSTSNDPAPRGEPSRPKPSLPEALARRRASLPKVGIGGVSAASHPTVAPSPLGSGSNKPAPTDSPAVERRLRSLTTRKLKPFLGRKHVLILDLRPPSHWTNSHLPDSHCLNVPSTLVRRPNFSIKRMVDILTPPHSDAVAKWKKQEDIIFVDADSWQASEASLLGSLASKFDREGYTGHLWYVQGGWRAVEEDGTIQAESQPVVDNTTPDGKEKGGMGQLGKTLSQHGSTSSLSASTPGPGLRSNPFDLRLPGSANAGSSTAHSRYPSFNLSDTNLALGNRAATAQPANPFFDNIRQNLELSHGGITERIPLGLASDVVERADELPPWLRDLVRMPADESADRLAQEFEAVERSEHKRYRTIVEFHSKNSGKVIEVKKVQGGKTTANYNPKASDNTEAHFPFSITAGQEKGMKNRYKNIYPFEHSRVKLESLCDDNSDYINASFVQPQGTTRRYIATQGPSEDTYRDFWNMVWEQGVRVILMITKQFEAGHNKCGRYWESRAYGNLKLQAVSQVGGDDAMPAGDGQTGFDFGFKFETPARAEPPEIAGNIKRRFTLANTDYPSDPPREIVQIQCTAWPDHDVPDDPHVLLDLMRTVDASVEELCGADDIHARDRQDFPPVVVHCSAGVGRSGSYILVDAISDGLRRERRAARAGRDIPAADSDHSGIYLHAPGRVDTPETFDTFASREGSEDSGLAAPSSIAGSGTGSGVGSSGKSVTFLDVPTVVTPEISDEPLSGKFADQSKIPENGRTPGLTSNEPKSYMDAGGGGMEVDTPHRPASRAHSEGYVRPDIPPPIPENRSLDFSSAGFTQHRGSVGTDFDSDTDRPRRPSLISAGASSSGVSESSSVPSALPDPSPLSKSAQRHFSPTPLSDLAGPSPIAVVLEGMREQRMSLVQSLRQYLFVHRAVITQYLQMVDEDKQRTREHSVNSVSSVPSSNPSRASPARTGAGPSRPLRNPLASKSALSFESSQSGQDDDSHVKRRASPTELTPDPDTPLGQGQANLAKRPSFKKMRSTEPVNMSLTPGARSKPTSPKKEKTKREAFEGAT